MAKEKKEKKQKRVRVKKQRTLWGNIKHYTLILLIACVCGFFLFRWGGMLIHKLPPIGGINKSMYVTINGREQWINIYGKDKDNPVLLYLHGGPGQATSTFDYEVLRKLSDVYTVVTWDNICCGKSASEESQFATITKESIMADGKEMTLFLMDYLDKDKISILGHSFGSIYGANLVLDYPEYYDTFIATAMMPDPYENEVKFIECAKEWSKGDAKYTKMAESLNVDNISVAYINAREKLLEAYHYDYMADGFGFNEKLVMLTNPYYSLNDLIGSSTNIPGPWFNFILSEDFKDMTVKARTNYEVGYYNINGTRDYQVNHDLAEEYFNEVTAPSKKLYMVNSTHYTLFAKPDDFSTYVHEIAEIENARLGR
ncbi:MAG: alpha/beta hydrolase [Clostridia bacterium]|nr:alpha/beta hydrolase [Clostridia bacterium]